MIKSLKFCFNIHQKFIFSPKKRAQLSKNDEENFKRQETNPLFSDYY